MSIQSVTANTQPVAALQSGNKAPTQAEVSAGKLPVAEARRTESAPEEARPDKQDEERQVREAVDNVEKFVAQSTRDITFSIDEDAGLMVKVIDRTSREVIRQIPSEEMVAIARALDKLQGLFIRDKI